MIFPFTIKYSRKLPINVSQSKIDNVLNYVSDYILNEDGEEIHIDKNKLTFKSSFFGFRLKTHIFKSIEKGKFVLINSNNESFLTYEFFMYRMISFFLLFAIFVGYHSQSIENGLLMLAGLGVNWIITIIRHKFMFGRIISGINKLNITEQ